MSRRLVRLGTFTTPAVTVGSMGTRTFVGVVLLGTEVRDVWMDRKAWNVILVDADDTTPPLDCGESDTWRAIEWAIMEQAKTPGYQPTAWKVEGADGLTFPPTYCEIIEAADAADAASIH